MNLILTSEQLATINPDNTWTQFYDMHSGGGQKLNWDKIYLELPEEEAIQAFEELFDRHPHNITCSCCGEDYTVYQSRNLYQATAYDRGCKWGDKEMEYVEEMNTKYGQNYYEDLPSHILRATQESKALFLSRKLIDQLLNR